MINNKIYRSYILICPIERIVKYVGITYQTLEERLNGGNGHLYPNKKSNPHKYHWIQKLKKQGLKPEIKLVCDNLTEEQACKMEIELIALYRHLVGEKLTNIHEGGNVPPVHYGDENPSKKNSVRKKISIKSKKMWENISFKEKMKEKQQGINHSQAKLTEHQVKEIRELRKNTNLTLQEIASKYNVGFKCISKIVNYQRWKHI